MNIALIKDVLVGEVNMKVENRKYKYGRIINRDLTPFIGKNVTVVVFWND